MLLQKQTTETWLVLAGRILIFVVYIVLFSFFKKGYARSKESGLPNKFLLGYTLFYGFLTCYGVLSLVDQFTLVFTEFGSVISKLDQNFATLYGITPAYQPIFNQLANPLYLLGLMILMTLIAAQVYPLEKILNWRRPLATAFMIIAAAGVLPVYLPVLSYSIYTDVASFMIVGGMMLGLILNIGINCKLAATTTGDLKKRSIAIIFASILFYTGFIMSLRFDAVSIFYQVSNRAIPMDYDVMLGYLLQSLSALLYWRGLKTM